MFRGLLLSIVLVGAGFVAGLAVTARGRMAGDSRMGQDARLAAMSRRQDAAAGTSAAQARPEPAPFAGRANATASAPATASGGPDFTRVAAQAVKGVANISSVTVMRSRQTSPFPDDEFFRYFFGDSELFTPRDRRSLSLGSGVIISPDGYIVTNNHVIGENVRASSTEITASLPDKREVRGKIIGTDPATDIALVKVNVTGLPAVPWGDSAQLKVGEWVLAIGSHSNSVRP